MRFMAMARVVWASRLIEPKLIAPVAKRLTISRGRLDLVERDRRFGPAEPHQAAQGQQARALVVDRLGEGLVLGGQVAAHRVLQARRPIRASRRGPRPAGGRRRRRRRRAWRGRPAHRHRRRVAAHAFLGDLRQADALDDAGRAGEVALDELARQAHGVEDLRAAVGLVGGDAHLGHHLQNALADRLDVVGGRLLGAQRRGVRGTQGLEGLEGEVGVHRLRPVAGQDAEVVHLARLAGLDDQAGLHAQALADQLVVHRRRRPARRGWGCAPAGGARSDRIRMFMSARTASVAAAHSRSSARSRPAAPSAAGQVASRVAVRKAPSSSSEMARIFSRSALVSTGWATSRRLCVAGLAAEQVGPGPDHRDQAHHQLLADRVDRRVGDLGEVLLEVVVEQLGPLGEHRQGRVGAHGADRILADLAHRLEEEGESSWV